MESNEHRASDHAMITIARGAGIAFTGIIIGSGLRYLFQVIVARNLRTEVFGLFFLGFAIFKVSAMITELGLPTGILRFIAVFDGEQDQRRVKGTIYFSVFAVLIAGIAVGVILFAFSGILSARLFHKPELTPILKFFAFVIPFTSVTTILTFSAQAFKIIKYKVYVREIFEPALRTVAVVLLFFMGFGLEGVMSSYIFVGVIAMVLALAFLKKVFPGLMDRSIRSIYEMKTIFAFSWPLMFAYLIGFLLLWTDTIVVGLLRNSQEIGIYGAAQRTGLLASVVISSFTALFAPTIADLFNKKKISDLDRLFKGVSKWVFAINLPLCLWLILFSKFILNLFGPEFSTGSLALVILVLGWLVHSSMGLLGIVLTMSGRSKLHLINTASLLCINILLNFYLIPKWGIAGAALATATSLTLVDLVSFIEVHFILKLTPFKLDFLKPLAAGAFACAFILMFTEALSIAYNNFPIVFVISVLFIILYGGSYMLLRFSEEDKIMINLIAGKILASK
jgi:O-antigen/teichoic acid export membrane protein